MNFYSLFVYLLHVSALRECHHQGVLTSVKVVSFGFVRNVRHNHSLTQSLTNTLKSDYKHKKYNIELKMLKQQLEHFSFSFIYVLIMDPRSSQVVSENLETNSEPKYGWSPEMWCVHSAWSTGIILPVGLQLFVCLYNYALQPLRLIVRSWLDVQTFATRRLHACYHAREGGTVGEKCPVILPKFRFIHYI